MPFETSCQVLFKYSPTQLVSTSSSAIYNFNKLLIIHSSHLEETKFDLGLKFLMYF